MDTLASLSTTPPRPAPPGIGRPRRIGIFRARKLGDLLCATPALRAIAAAWPGAERVLIGLPWARPLAERWPTVDRFIEFPGWPGLPECPPELGALPAFLQAMQAERFDLLLQLHGSDGRVNPLLAACGAMQLAGFAAADEAVLDPALGVRWPEQGSQAERLLALTDHLGLPRAGTALDFPLRGADRDALRRCWPAVDEPQPYVCVHPGARLPTRRWPVASFAALADRIAARGWRVVLAGSAAETRLTDAVRDAMQQPAVDLAGRTDLWTLGALIQRAALLVCNDTGVSHIAAALDTPSVIVSCGADAARLAPADARRQVVLWQPAACRPCQHAHCPVGHGCATGLAVPVVDRAVRQQLGVAA
ncbi:glycosyltransferase family 9 protein [Aquincola sp. S2]|uniref:Glycosyltransferase family 9 protein n=1 Tax=Pseudaquabacterium terrae TaxID=2732868 RepID=A0ABX2EHZ9_9BURK|nr:glycosyltransferase family 9 protein [Aquabacterium terrae]NRF68201.1 glycosyltransferase family 9 protein [Aquabacterium terrae]